MLAADPARCQCRELTEAAPTEDGAIREEFNHLQLPQPIRSKVVRTALI